MPERTMKVERIAELANYKLLEIKDSDIRILTVHQGKTAVDKGLHIGGAFSAVIPVVSLYYGDVMKFDVENPTAEGQDLFVLSKGHAIAAVASVYADLGFFPESYLENSRSYDSILNGHPGPILPGIHTATGPLGQGVCVAEGFALAAKIGRARDVFCLTGDGELQEGVPWEGIMYAGAKRLDNLCMIVDKNEGQLDSTQRLTFSMARIEETFESLGWRVLSVDSTRYEPVLEALRDFKYGPRDGKPTAIICNSQKGWGGLSNFMGNHKVDVPDSVADQEILLQERRREVREADLAALLDAAGDQRAAVLAQVREDGKRMGLLVSVGKSGEVSVKEAKRKVKMKRAAKRDKKIVYDAGKLPVFDPAKKYVAADVVTSAMKVFALDSRVASVDADLASVSGLEKGTAFVDVNRAVNVGIAEANMMCVAEAMAALGYNVWGSTFCPFFDWKVLRRIAVSYQERLESIERKDGWLAAGHGLDITFLALAPDLETKTNGATHMGNDDLNVYDGVAHLKMINASCPQQLLSVMKWIMEGGKGLVYLRILRSGSGILYGKDFVFEYGKGYYLRKSPDDRAYIVSSGRGIYEAIEAVKLLRAQGISVGVVDMPSVDAAMIGELYESGRKIVIAEQNNGYLWSHFRKVLFGRKKIETGNLVPINLLDEKGMPRFIHSAAYDELLQAYGLAPKQIAERIRKLL